MSEREFENYLALMARLLQLRGGQREAIARELRDHMEARLDALLAQGISRDEAVRIALEEFGDAAGLAGEFIQVARFRKKRWIMRAGIGSVTAAAAMIMAVMAMWPEQQGPLSTPTAVAQDGGQEETEGEAQGEQRASHTGNRVTEDAARNAKVMEALSEPATIELFDTPLSEAISFLERQLDVDIFIDKRALEDAAIPTDVPVTLAMNGHPAELLLELMLRELRLAYVVRSGLIIVTTPDVAEEMLEVRVYDVGDLIAGYPGGYGMGGMGMGGMRMGGGMFSVPSDEAGGSEETSLEAQVAQVHAEACAHCHQVDDAHANLHRIPIHFTQLQATQVQGSPAASSGLNAPGGIGRGSTGTGQPHVQLAPEAAAMRDLIELVTTVVDVDSWQENGGLGTIRAYRSALVIAQTEPVHRKVQDLLDGLRAVVQKNQNLTGGAATAIPGSQPPAGAASSRPGGYRPPGAGALTPSTGPAPQGLPGARNPSTGPAPQGVPGAESPFGGNPFGDAPIGPNKPNAPRPAGDPAAPKEPFEGENPFGDSNRPGAEAPASDAAADPFSAPASVNAPSTPRSADTPAASNPFGAADDPFALPGDAAAAGSDDEENNDPFAIPSGSNSEAPAADDPFGFSGGPDAESPSEPETADFDALIELITRTVKVDSGWSDSRYFEPNVSVTRAGNGEAETGVPVPTESNP
jgi:hypothetical protein